MQTNENYFTLIGIDPGSDKLGVSLYKVEFDTFKILESRAFTIIASKMVNERSWLAQIHSYRTARIYKLRECLLEYFNKIQPSVIACESPFFNPRRPGAFQPLVEVLSMIKDAVIEYSVWQPLFMIDPSSIKNSVHAAGNADKDKMKESVLKLTDLAYNGDIELKDLDEHSIDALAVGYCQIKYLKDNSNQ
jgi:Holliday junction resolvasome RuvABC endonuclease subunit